MLDYREMLASISCPCHFIFLKKIWAVLTMLLALGLFSSSSFIWLALQLCLLDKWESQEVKNGTLHDGSTKATVRKLSTPNTELLFFWEEGVLCLGSTNTTTLKHTVVFLLHLSVWVLNVGCIGSLLIEAGKKCLLVSLVWSLSPLKSEEEEEADWVFRWIFYFTQCGRVYF